MSKRTFIFGRIASLFLILVFLLAYLHTGQLYVAFGPSMEPTIYDGERIVVDKRAYEVVNPAPGDVVSMISPNKGMLYVKRVVGQSGDEVKISPAGIEVNSKPLLNSEGPWETKRLILNKDEVFVLGDNRYDSDDSRSFGPIKKKDILGEVKAVIWPPSSIRLIR